MEKYTPQSGFLQDLSDMGLNGPESTMLRDVFITKVKFKFFLLLDWLKTKARQPMLLQYLHMARGIRNAFLLFLNI